MRAVFVERSHLNSETLTLSDERAHHLLNVVRLKKDEKVLILDGEGSRLEAEVLELKKKELTLKVLTKEFVEKRNLIHLALGIPSREAFEDVLRESVELGINTIQPLISDFSEKHFELTARFQRILESALIQSNNPYFPTILPALSFDDYLSQMTNDQSYLLFTARTKLASSSLALTNPTTILVGPEGGFSASEEEKLETRANVNFIHLPSYILRTPTAVTCACGFVFSKHFK